jgi:uncharacterized protein HemX
MDPNQQQPITPATSQPTFEQPTATPEHKKVGPIVAVLVIVLVLIIGALYLFASQMNNEQAPIDTSVAAQMTPSTETSSELPAPTATVQPVTNTADDLSSLEADLNTSAKGLDTQSF